MTRFGAVDSNEEVVSVDTQSPTPSSDMTISHTAGRHTIAEWTAGENENVDISGSQNVGDRLTLIIHNDGLLGRTISFGSGIVASGSISSLLSQDSTIIFVSNGTSFYEVARVEGL